jgi:signal peptide peptidase SppA
MNQCNLSDLAGVWLMREQELRILTAGQMTPSGNNASMAGEVCNTVCIIPINGPLSKSPAWWSDGMSTVAIQRSLRAAVANPAVTSILLHVDSPGGTAAGTAELADDVAAAAKQKPVWAYCNDLCASAAYWVASQATRVFANRTAIVGSIGTYSVVIDGSKMAEKAGLVVHVVRAGQHKGSGVFGTAISAAELEERQKLVNALNSHFLAGVASGRKMKPSRVTELADGRAHISSDAVKLGLIDGISTLDSVFSQMVQGQFGTSPTGSSPSKKAKQMDPIQEWEEAVRAKLAQNPRMKRGEAVRALSIEQPELHASYLAAYTEKFGDKVRGRR